MGKYIASPWGFTSGKVGDTVGSSCKGVYYTKMRVIPDNPGSIGRYYCELSGQCPPGSFAPKQMNLRYPCSAMLGYQAKMNRTRFIRFVWDNHCEKNALTQSGTSLFVGTNARALFNSMPDNTVKFALGNMPDYSKMRIAIGELEPIPKINGVAYNPGAGFVGFTWDTNIYGNGSPGDKVLAFIYYAPQDIEVELFRPWGVFYEGTGNWVRSDGMCSFNIPRGLNQADIYGYLFCRSFTGATKDMRSDSVSKKSI